MEVYADGLVFTWVKGTGPVTAVKQDALVEYLTLVDSMPWRMEYLGWSERLGARLFRRGEDRLLRLPRVRRLTG